MNAEPPAPVRAIDRTMLADDSKAVGANFQLLNPVDLDGALLDGCYGTLPLRTGLSLNVSDAVDLHDLVTRVEQRPGLTLQVFLKGPINACLGGRPLFPGAADDADATGYPKALVTARTRPELFERRGVAGTHVRKVSVLLSHDWLEDCAPDPGGTSAGPWQLATRHLAQRSWRPGPALVGLAETILGLSHSPDPIRRLHLESRVIDLVAEMFSVLVERPCGAAGRLDARDVRRMRRIEECLAASGHTVMSLEDLARAVPVSISTLQRLFQACHGMSASEFIRRRNLEHARVALDHHGVSVKEAAFLAGYSNPANFSTAFRRHFGRSPRQGHRSRT